MTTVELVVARRERIADGVVMLTLRRPDGGDLPAWAPGAHLDLILRPDLVRQYSLCGDPADRSALQLAIKLEPDGRGGSRFVHERLHEGDPVEVRGPRNHFPLVDAEKYLFIAGGIGITPIKAMVAAVDAAGADWRLVYGGRTRASMAFAAELREHHADQVHVYPLEETGLLDIDTLLDDAADRVVYCCGPEPLIAAVQERCRTWPPHTLHVERFSSAAGQIDGGADSAFEVELALSGRTLTVPPGKPILQALEEAGVAVLSSCREGTCGTCETTVLDGVPDHRDSLLTEQERTAGDTVLICVSRAHTPRLVLEL